MEKTTTRTTPQNPDNDSTLRPQNPEDPDTFNKVTIGGWLELVGQVLFCRRILQDKFLSASGLWESDFGDEWKR